jgi:hypothetical protein
MGVGNGRHTTVLTRRWYNFFAPLILTVTITTNILPYVRILTDLIINKCIRKKLRSELEFEMERKYAQILNTIFVVYTYGFGIPLLFPYLLFPLTLLSILDKLLITYWYKPKPVYSELLDRTFFFLLKYAPVLLLAIAGGTIYNSYCISNNKVQFLENFNHF